MVILTLVLSPIVAAMRLILTTIHAATGSYGVSIILLSLVVRCVTAPLAIAVRKAEARERVVQASMEPELIEIHRTSTGRERFERTEELYNRHGYHPIQSVTSLVPLFLQIPFLLAALFLLSDYPPLAGERFLFIPDLLKPDGLASGINVLPILIIAATLAELCVKTGMTRSARMRFLVVAAVITVLIYPAPAGVCLYWLSSTIWSLLSTLYERVRTPVEATS